MIEHPFRPKTPSDACGSCGEREFHWNHYVTDPTLCNTMFCTLTEHDDDTHMDVTGYTWTEALQVKVQVRTVTYTPWKDER